MKAKEIFTNIKTALPSAIYWTIAWLAFVFLACLFIWEFNIFLPAHWDILSDKILWGFSGFSFMLFFAAAPVIWLAVMIQIFRAKKFPYKIVNMPAKKKDASKKEEPVAPQPEEPAPKLPSGIPEELKEPFLRMARGQLARGAIDTTQTESAAPMPAPASPAPAAEPEPVEMLPLPDDFSASTDTPAAPVFKEISFDSPTLDLPAPPKSSHIEIKDNNGEKQAIYTHADSDFWIADDDNWFASGKQIPSPIKQLLQSAADNSAIPVLKLSEKNIMDLDNKRAEWEKMGIKVEG